MSYQTDQRTPIFICITNSVSGVTSWALTLKNAFKDHPKYELFLMNLWYAQKSDAFDFNPADLDEAHEIFETLSPSIVIPNYNWDILNRMSRENLAFVGMCHSDSEDEYYAPLHNYQEKFAKFIAVSDVCATTLTERLPGRAADIVMFPCGIKVPEAIGRPYKTDPIRLVYGGRIVQKQKRVFDLVDLAQQLQSRNVDFVLNIVGEGADCAELKEKMSTETTSGNVHFLGRKAPAEMGAIWAEHDLFIQVSDFEGTSVSMLEAMAQGTIPMVTAASSGVIGVIEDSKNGLIAPVGDMRAMAKTIETLVSKPKSLLALGKAAHLRAKHYSIDAYLNDFIEVIDSVAGQLKYIRPDKKQFKAWAEKVEAAHEKTRATQNQLDKLITDHSIEIADYEQRLNQSRSDIQQLNQQIADQKIVSQQLEQQLSQSHADVQGLNQQISDQKALAQQLEQQHKNSNETLKQQANEEAHKGHLMFEQLEQKDAHIAWLENEVKTLNGSFSLRIGRRFYPIKAFFNRLTGRSD